jgi:hypothetical protein
MDKSIFYFKMPVRSTQRRLRPRMSGLMMIENLKKNLVIGKAQVTIR